MLSHLPFGNIYTLAATQPKRGKSPGPPQSNLVFVHLTLICLCWDVSFRDGIQSRQKLLCDDNFIQWEGTSLPEPHYACIEYLIRFAGYTTSYAGIGYNSIKNILSENWIRFIIWSSLSTIPMSFSCSTWCRNMHELIINVTGLLLGMPHLKKNWKQMDSIDFQTWTYLTSCFTSKSSMNSYTEDKTTYRWGGFLFHFWRSWENSGWMRKYVFKVPLQLNVSRSHRSVVRLKYKIR